MSQQQLVSGHSNHVKDVYDILVDILSRLPVKSLLRFQSVCKSWRSLISDSYFVKKHLKHAQTSNYSLKLLYLPNTTSNSDYRRPTTVNIHGWSEHDDTHHQYSPIDDYSNRYKVIGSCNGLVCVRVYDAENNRDIFIWNPSTRVIKRVPKPDLALSLGHFCGFSYDASADDYKLIMDIDMGTKYGIFSLKTGSWRFVDQDFKFGLIDYRQGDLVNGALHWQQAGSATRVISYDLANAKWERLCSIADKSRSSITIGSTGNRLCYWLYNPRKYKPQEISVWVMKEYGKDKAWIKLMDIPIKFEGSHIYPSGEQILENGEALMIKDRKEYVVYSSRENKYRAIPQPHSKPWCTEVVVYLDTLVSPQFRS